MNWDWVISAIAIAHITGTMTFFLTALANMWIYNGENRYNTSVKEVVILFIMSNLWLKAWHSGLYGFFLTPREEDIDEQ